MSRPTCIHAWLARDKGLLQQTRLHTEEPTKAEGFSSTSYWHSPRPGGMPMLGNHGLRPGQIKRVVIVEDEG